MSSPYTQPRFRQLVPSCCVALCGLFALTTNAASQVAPPYSEVAPLLGALRELPSTLSHPTDAKWNAWRLKADRDIRARLAQGDLDTMVNLLLFGTSFTTQPRIAVQNLADASRTGLLRARVDDLVVGLGNPGNERLSYLRDVLVKQHVPPEDPKAVGKFVLDNLNRVLQEKVALAKRAEAAKTDTAKAPEAFSESANLFRDRGISLDTTILPNYGVEAGLAVMKRLGVLPMGSVARVAVIGPGLDFVDKDAGFDYYPLQTLQPFAIYDSLMRLGLTGSSGPRVTVFDISAQVLKHLARARERAGTAATSVGANARGGYDLQLPRDPSRNLSQGAIDYWSRFGSEIGTTTQAIKPSESLSNIQTRAIRLRPKVVLAVQPVDLNIVTQRLQMAPAERFDLVIATNMFVYYNTLEQALAIQNVAAMLKPGGWLLTNDELADLPGLALRKRGSFTLFYGDGPAAVGDTMLWYGR